MTDLEPGRRATMRDVAGLARVSHQTVSRYFRNEGGLKAATRARIDDAVAQLSYRPNLIARSMRTRRNGRLAVILPTVAFNPARLLAGATSAAHEAGYAVDVVSLAGGSTGRGEHIPELIGMGQFEGLLSYAPLPANVAESVDTGTAIVVSGDFDDEMRGIGKLADGSTVAAIIEHLAALGHRRFLHIAGSEDFASARARRRVYGETIERLGLRSLGIAGGNWTGEAGRDAIAGLSESDLPVAVVAANDLIAAGAVRASLDRGWRIPGDLSVIGWDDEPIGRFLTPSLSSVSVDLERLGRNGMLQLLAKVTKKEVALEDGPLYTILWRESVGEPTD
ncbi:LacI family DNA-binding transcriptional regulator [Microbacterium panaciterrae]|uniref:LacI family DNA-binding transcriptional regulator n=1 Tax=Microbacterium panaciterrae TaxID=985759 RepID=A0ABP8PIT1_9MICO